MQAIQVKYLPCTDTKLSRWKAWCCAGSLTVSYDHAFNADQNARFAAERLADRLNWKTPLLSGTLPNGDFVFVFDNELSRI